MALVVCSCTLSLSCTDSKTQELKLHFNLLSWFFYFWRIFVTRIAVISTLFLTLFAIPVFAEDHRFLVRGDAALGSISNAEAAEDDYFYPLNNAIAGSLTIPSTTPSYKCPASLKPRMFETPEGSQERKDGCRSMASGVRAEYRFQNMVRVFYDRFSLPNASYSTNFNTPVFAPGVNGVSQLQFGYNKREGRTRGGVGFYYPVLDKLHIGVHIAQEKNFMHFGVTPASYTLYRVGNSSLSGLVAGAGIRELQTRGATPGAGIEFDPMEYFGISLEYDRIRQRGSYSDNRVSGAASSTAGILSIGNPVIETIQAGLTHSGYEAGLDLRFGKGRPIAFYLGGSQRKYVRSYQSYFYTTNSTFLAGPTITVLNNLYLAGLYTSHRFIQNENLFHFKMELGLGF